MHVLLWMACVSEPADTGACCLCQDPVLELSQGDQVVIDSLYAPRGPSGWWAAYMTLTAWHTEDIVEITVRLGEREDFYRVQLEPLGDCAHQIVEIAAHIPEPETTLCTIQPLQVCLENTCQEWTVFVDSGEC